MTAQDFRSLLKAEPFQPFRIVMSSGETHDVPLPGMAFVTQTTFFVGSDMGDDGIPAEFRTCSLTHVTAIEPISLAISALSIEKLADP